MPIEEKAQILAPAGQNNFLVGRLLAVDDVVIVETALPALQKRIGSAQKAQEGRRIWMDWRHEQVLSLMGMISTI